jgi:hypothetical protein
VCRTDTLELIAQLAAQLSGLAAGARAPRRLRNAP